MPVVPGHYERKIEERIRARRCTRGEWHALRRLRGRRRRAEFADDLMLMAPYALAVFAEAFRAFTLRTLERAA